MAAAIVGFRGTVDDAVTGLRRQVSAEKVRHHGFAAFAPATGNVFAGTSVAVDLTVEGERALEYRFVVDRSAAEGVLRRAATRLTPEFHAPGRPVVYCRTLYLDSADGMYLHTFKRGATACRARVRQYAAAGDIAGEALVTGGSAWLELKRSCGLEREKLRLEWAADELSALLHGEAPAAAGLSRRGGVSPALGEVISHLAAGRIRPCLLTWYRRWSLGRAPLRITLDEGIAYALPEPLAAAGSRCEPGAVIARDALAVLEVKLRGAMPGWLEEEVAGVARHLALRHSKFRAGMEAIRQAQPTTPRNDREFRNTG